MSPNNVWNTTARLSAPALETPLSLITCTSRPEILEQYWARNLACLSPGDQYLVVIDMAPTLAVRAFANRLEAGGVACIVNDQNHGLSVSRNKAMDLCRHSKVLFIDDEVSIPADTLPAVRQAFARGAGVVGTRILGPEQGLTLPWCISEGQLHYLAIHTPATLRIWGACMGLDVEFARRHGIRFRDDLSRRTGNLLSGDDTTFVQRMRDCGAQHEFLEQVWVHHNIRQTRLRLSYVLRRAYWQGRAERRRARFADAMRKELVRSWSPRVPFGQRLVLSILYCGAVAFGFWREALHLRAPDVMASQQTEVTK